MKFASSRAKRISHAKRISRSEGVFHSPQANFVEKRPTLASWSFFWLGHRDSILVAATQSRENFGFATLLGQSRLWRATGTSFTTAPLRIPVFDPAKAKRTPEGVLCFGWGTGIRTPEMSESESDALPLGDAPIFSTLHIIADNFALVNTYFQLFWKIYSIFRKKELFCFTTTTFCGTIHNTSA